ncbi:choice-of-anchor Q domain-containing protein [Gloeocapsa sp. PCC 73106]|uniref:choice-of-anchor Q domain-containing protein n=1 Tax=Gloeocapsa sp. PCC 73106 TaxID=102232 RepID=UPI0002AC4818|nr:choice-of-anchor Q domain-containing protein [Gloeocapsa sp. PCC 73106]ELR96933.1 hypothetical protein GLO73106DRAFT_00007340 [Gloeocapsa sp. PCC 73106]
MATVNLTVNTTTDQFDGSGSNGLSLREAIASANASPNDDYIITLSAGSIYRLTLDATNGDESGSDLDIFNGANVSIRTDGSLPATIDAGGLLDRDRVFYVSPNSTLNIDNAIITRGSEGGDGGGIYIDVASVTLTNVILSENFASDDGGAIYNNSGNLEIINSSLRNNSAQDVGGAIDNRSGNAVIINSSLENNSASNVGGAIYSSGNLRITSSAIVNNFANRLGGGIYQDFSSSNIINTTISGNRANSSGGGIYHANGILNLNNVTVADNIADVDNQGEGAGGGIYKNSGTVDLTNTIVAQNFDTPNNSGPNSTSPDVFGNFFGNRNNLIGNTEGSSGFDGTDLVNLNPLLGALSNNGGSTRTHALLNGSRAIDAGNTNIVAEDTADLDGDNNRIERIPFDQRGIGFERVVGSIVDIGAYEVQSTTSPLVFVTVSPSSVTEDGSANLVYTFTRTGNIGAPLNNVNIRVGGSATFNNDYTQNGANSFNTTAGTISFGANQATKTLTIDPTRDTTVEPNETVAITVSSGTGYTVSSPSTATGTISDDDLANVSVTVSPSSVTENGSTNLVYTFRRTGVISNPLNNVRYNVGGTGTFNNDYNQSGAASFSGSTGSINFAANQATKTVTIDPIGDTTVESNETVVLTLVNGTGYVSTSPTSAIGTISNDDASVSVTLSPTSVREDGTANLVYTFRRTGNISSPLNNVRFNVSATATLNNDYIQSGAASFNSSIGSINFGANQSSKTVTINPTADTRVEPNETIRLALVNGTGYTISGSTSATGTIINDDASNNSLMSIIEDLTESIPNLSPSLGFSADLTSRSVTTDLSADLIALGNPEVGAIF